MMGLILEALLVLVSLYVVFVVLIFNLAPFIDVDVCVHDFFFIQYSPI